MQISENITLAIAGLKANKMRAILTMLGIIIGISSVIGIVMVGDSLKASVEDSMQGLGATNIMAMVQEKDTGTGMSTSRVTVTEKDKISDEMIDALKERYPNSIQQISMTSSVGPGKAKDGKLYANVSIMGINEGYIKANNIEMIKGRGVREGDIKSKRNTAVVSDKFVKNMFKPGEDPLGKEVKVSFSEQMQTFTIVGVYKYIDNMGALMMMGGSVSGKDISTNFMIPVTTAKALSSEDSGYELITVTANKNVNISSFSEEITDFLNSYYTKNTKFKISVISMEAAMASMTTMLGSVSIAISVIAGISLLVGGIGVMNIMLVSVTERTREIGTRKALGAKNKYIMTQFIIEAVIICSIGGVIGIALGMGMGFLGSMLMGFPAAPSIGAIAAAVLFSMAIGVFFGYYPANKAAKLNPIDALRYE